MKRLEIYSIDEIYKSMISHEPKKPPSMVARLRPTKATAEGYTAPKSMGHPSAAPKVGNAFSVKRKKGPEEAKRYAKRIAREKTEERRSDIASYGQSLEKGKSIKEWKEYLQIEPEKSNPSDNISSIGRSKKDGKWYGWSHRAINGFQTREEAKKFAESVS